jgi:hypothetical protein
MPSKKNLKTADVVKAYNKAGKNYAVAGAALGCSATAVRYHVQKKGADK